MNKTATHEIKYEKILVTSPDGEVLSVLHDAQLSRLKDGKVRTLHSWSEIEQLVKTSTCTTHSSWIEK